jgi:hypothetical protein
VRLEREKALGKDFIQSQPLVLFEKCSKLAVFNETSLPFIDLTNETTNRSLSTFISNVTDESTVCCSLQNGKSIFLKKRSFQNTEEITNQSGGGKAKKNQYLNQLLSRPIEFIINEGKEIEIQRLARFLKEYPKSQNVAPISNHDDEDDDNSFGFSGRKLVDFEEPNDTPKVSKETVSTIVNSDLWVDKYSPKTFTQVSPFCCLFSLCFIINGFTFFVVT